MPRTLVPLAYMVVAIIAAFVLPRIEYALDLRLGFGISAGAALAALSAIAGGMMALTAIVFSIAFVMIQFSAIAYSPRVALRFANDRLLFHSLGIFSATFVYALAAILWVERGGTGRVPEVSWSISTLLLIASLTVFTRLVQRLTDLQVTNTLRVLGDVGRQVIADVFEAVAPPGMRRLASAPRPGQALPPASQAVRHRGPPASVERFELEHLVELARQAEATIVMACAVGDTLAESDTILRVHGGGARIAEGALRRAVRLAPQRTADQDPKYPIRLLVDIAIKALSPAINDPTTAVQALDQIEDLLRRLARHELDIGTLADADGTPRLIVPMPCWDDYLSLALDEIRMFGVNSIQVTRRLRHTLIGLRELLGDDPRGGAVIRYIAHLDEAITASPLDTSDRAAARQDDPQGLGLARGGGEE